MKIVTQVVIIVVAAAITLGAAIHQGRTSNRWGLSGQMTEVVPVVQTLPRDIGRWRLQDTEKMSAYEERTLQCADYLKATYVNQDTKQQVQALLLLGPPGPTSVHRPEICYSAIDFPQDSERTSVVLQSHDEGKSDTAWMVQFRNNKDVSGGLLRVYYAWSDGSKWQASEEPRITYGTRPYLFKFQVNAEIDDSATGDDDDAAKAFLIDFIPVFEQLIAQHTDQVKPAE